MASSRHHSPSLQQLQEQLNEEDLWLNTTTFPQGPNSPEGFAWRLNDFNHPHTPTSDDKRESPTIPTNLLEFLTSTPPGKLSSMNGSNGGGGCGGGGSAGGGNCGSGSGGTLNNRHQSMLKLRRSEQQQFLAQQQQQQHNQSPQQLPRGHFYDHIEHNQSLPDDFDSDLDFISSLPPTTLAAAINHGQLPVSGVETSVNGRPQLCYILATAPNSAASHLPQTSSILALATPTSRHSPIQDSQVFPPPCYDSLPRSAAAAAAASPSAVASASQTDGVIDAADHATVERFTADKTPSLPPEPPAVSQSAQTDHEDYAALLCSSATPVAVAAASDLPSGASRVAQATKPLTPPLGELDEDDQQQQPGTPDSLPLCCYPPVYVDDLEDHVGWDTDYEDGLTLAMGAAKID